MKDNNNIIKLKSKELVLALEHISNCYEYLSQNEIEIFAFKYPFHKSLDEIVADCREWKNDLLNSL